MYKLDRAGNVIRLSDGASIPNDARNVDRQEYQAWISKGNAPQPADAPTPAQIEATFSDAIQKRLDDFARQREYDGIVSLCSYAGDPDPTLNAEGTLGVTKRSQTWVKMKQIRAQVLAGTRPMPTSFADIEADLPALTWPA